MARYRKIDPRIWNDQKFSSFSERGKLLFFYVLTHPNMTMIGMLRATPEGLFSELGMSAADCQADWQALCHAGVVEYDKQGLVRLPNFLKYNEPESPSVVKAWSDCYDLLPECDLLKKGKDGIEKYLISRGNSWIQAYNHTAKQPNGQTASQPAMQTARHQEQEQEQEQEQNKYTSQSSATASDASEDVSRSDLNPQKPDDVTTVKWKRYLKLRKQKNLPLTVDALELLKREAGKAGKTISEVIDFCLENSYAGFKASWESTSAPAGEARPNNAPPAFGKISGKQASFFGAKLAEMLGDRLPMQYRRGAKSWDEVGQRCADAMVQNEGEWNSYWLPALVKVGLVKGATA